MANQALEALQDHTTDDDTHANLIIDGNGGIIMKIKLKRGLSSNITAVNLDQGEPAWCTDTGKLYVGDGTSNILVNPDGGTATEAAKLSVARTISLSGDASGSIIFDGSSDATLSVTVSDDSHNHIISNVDGLQTALDAKLATSLKGANSGLAELDASGKIPTNQLPSFVDDVLEFESQSNFPATGESGKTEKHKFRCW